MLFSHWLFWLKNWCFSINCCKGFIVSLSLHYNGTNSFLFVNATKIYQFKAKDSEIKDHVLRLGNISKNLTINMKTKTGLKEVTKFHSIEIGKIQKFWNNV